VYTIKEAAARTGLSIPTVRVWERRYGVVRPTRTAAGYRLYDDESIRRLVAMRHLVEEEGWRPSQAAEHVIAVGADAAVASGSADESDTVPRSDDRGVSSARTAELAIDGFLVAAHQFDVPAMERILDESFASQRFESAMDDIVFPALRGIGDAWSAGEIDVAAEHAASETVRRRLARFFDAAGRGDRIPQVIVGLPPGSQHEIGAFAFAVAARRVGLHVLYLGANVPLESWLRTVRESGASVAVVAVVAASDVSAASVVVDALRSTPRPLTCAIGGLSAREVPDALGAVLLPDSLDGSVAAVARVLSHDGGPAR
jgi:methylmalonyl-CoA mutase cobalamin-binding subunit